LEKTAFLDIPQQISHTDIFKDTTMNNYSIINGGKLTNNFRQNYAISMWIYLNPQPSNYSAYAKETTIFRYGNDILDLSGGKPLITYINNIKDPKQKDKYIFYFTNDTTDGRFDVTNFEISLPSQRWNNIVFNYTSTVADLFINGKLERSFAFDNNSPTYSQEDHIMIGDKDGLDGAISNVRYFTQPLKRSQIVAAYNVRQGMNPP